MRPLILVSLSLLPLAAGSAMAADTGAPATIRGAADYRERIAVPAGARLLDRPGADRDPHGCIGSAGYLWCARENACVRPWELAGQMGFALSEDAFRAYCAASE